MSFVSTRRFALTLTSLSRAAFAVASVGFLALGAAACSDDGSSTGSPSNGSGGAASGGTASGGTASGGTSTGGTATGGNDTGTGGTATGGTASGGTAATGDLDAAYSDFFPVGVALQQSELDKDKELIAANFNHLTAGNAMKASSIHPAENVWNTAEADYLADFARDHGWKMTGHTLVWHQQQADWMFAGLTNGDAASIDTLKARLKAHIEYMVNRYADVVDNWDVVNEVVVSNTVTGGVPDFRKTNNKWWDIFQSPEYVYWAFRYTKDALEAKKAGSSVGKLYYNDYNINQKLDGVLALCDWLKNHSEGITIDGIGEQSHWRTDWPSATELENEILVIAAAGYKVKISELDLTVYNDYPAPDYSFVAAPEVPFTTALDTTLANRYKDLFAMFRRQKANLTSVTLWGFRDEDSWLNQTPVKDRHDYPLLFNASGAKAAYSTVETF